MKHIEQITSEQAIGEINRLALSDDMLTTALNKLYADATGLGEVKPSAPVTSDAEEMPSLMTYLLRKIFGTTTRVFRGASLLSEFRAVYNWLRERLKGSADYYIPAVPLDPSKLMSEHLRLLDSRDISSGMTLTLDRTLSTCPDGLSLAQFLCSGLADNVTEIVDSNRGWVMTRNILSFFPNLTKLELGMKEIRFYNQETNYTIFSGGNIVDLCLYDVTDIVITTQHNDPAYGNIFSFNLEKVSLPKLKYTSGCLFKDGTLPEEVELPELQTATRGLAQGVSGIKRIIAPKLTTCNGYSYNPNVLSDCPDLEYAYIPNLSAYTTYGSGDGASSLQDMPKLSHLVIGKAPFTNTSTHVRFALDNCPNLVLLDIRGGLNQNIYLDHWSPTTALAERLPEFLSNFQTYIADRVVDRTNTTALTLTLSAAVYEALQAQEGQTILATLTNKNWTVAQA